MVAYIAAQLQIHDPARYQTYSRRFASTLTGFGGRLLVADDQPDVRDRTNGTITLSPTSVLADDDNLIARARVTAERGGKHLDTENCYAFRFVEGKVADGQVFLSDPAQVEDFFA